MRGELQYRDEEDNTMQMGGVGQTSGKDMFVRETTTINQWQWIRAKGSYGKRHINEQLPQ